MPDVVITNCDEFARTEKILLDTVTKSVQPATYFKLNA